MPDGISSLPRNVLTAALGGDVRAARAFEQEAANNADTTALVASNADATDALQDATVIVLSPNATLNNERVLKLGDGITAKDDGSTLTLSVTDTVAHVQGGHRLALVTAGDTLVVMPLVGTLATQEQPETLVNKTLSAPILTNIGDYTDDATAAAGNVPVGGIYATAGVLKIRRA